ncbi:GAF domain-containing protein [Sphingomonas sp. CFBP 13728]|uniref:histidine kinase dimerization/phosphoacceptor domain -containing protein n=2 Tax=unclassified Sphingomonas TaxID=196159 RepID=UPI0017843E6F|nr:histidine kinase dimerization/phosphoacceptor domain -containing protein [Sphingomonas sp. CFBP 13728]MBD8618466.1 GAF domain-containing protein [Sphingomonas sp. CFBP 13728]
MPSSAIVAPGHGPSSSSSGIDACDREPIHIPGSIQPHGLLLVASLPDLTIVAGAGDIETSLARDWLGRPLGELLRQAVTDKLDARPTGSTVALNDVQGIAQTFVAIAHRSLGKLIVELEPAPASMPSSIDVLSAMEEAAATFEQAFGLRELCERAARAFRNLTGFDRVMVYRFLDDDAGVVVAEDRDPAANSFLNQHFPASDIPSQARALYVRNRVRIIPDAGYEPAPIRPQAAASLDLSDVGLRSVSPIHLQYLKNMGVTASASISIVRDGRLWGLIACHHPTTRFLPLHVRMACRALAGSLSRQIRAKEDAELYRERIRLRSAEDAVVLRLGSDISLAGFFATAGDDMCRMLGADSFAAVRGGELYVAGRSPRHADVLAVAAYVGERARTLPFSTDRLSEQLPDAVAYQDLASGVLAVTMSTDEPTILIWFRAEQIEVVNWAGNPHKDVPADPAATLSPRASFESWSEAVRGRSAPWTLFEIEAASRLRRTMFEARQNRRLFEVNRELTATIADNESLLLQKDYLIKEVHHRVQNSLQLVSAFLGLQGKAVGDEVLTAHLAEAQRRLSAVAMVHRRLHSDEHLQAIDLARYIGDLCAEIKSSMDRSWGDAIQLDLAPVLISTERAVNVGLILTELVINANKYAYAGGSGPITIELEQHRNRFRLVVSDRGAGKTGTGAGFGSRMLSSMVKRLAGTIEETDNDPGLRVTVTAPIADE